MRSPFYFPVEFRPLLPVACSVNLPLGQMECRHAALSSPFGTRKERERKRVWKEVAWGRGERKQRETVRKQLKRQISRVMEVKIVVTSLVSCLSANAHQIPIPVSTLVWCLHTWGLMITYLDSWEGRDTTSLLCGILSLLSPCQASPG